MVVVEWFIMVSTGVMSIPPPQKAEDVVTDPNNVRLFFQPD